jgi:hypothetical protein
MPESLSFYDDIINAMPAIRYREPWPISPNIIPKKNGYVTTVKTAGLASR